MKSKQHVLLYIQYIDNLKVKSNRTNDVKCEIKTTLDIIKTYRYINKSEIK